MSTADPEEFTGLDDYYQLTAEEIDLIHEGLDQLSIRDHGLGLTQRDPAIVALLSKLGRCSKWCHD